MADMLKIGPEVGRNDYRTMLAQSLMNSDGFDNRHWTGPVASMASKIGGALLQKSAMDDQTKQRADMMATLLAQKNAKPWTNPDTGEVAPGTSGGLEGMISGLAGMKDNPYAQDLLPGLLSADIAQQEAQRRAEAERRAKEEDDLRKRGWQVEDRNYATDSARDLKAAPGWVAPRQPVPGVDTPLPDDVQAQKIARAEAAASAKAKTDIETDLIKRQNAADMDREKMIPSVKARYRGLENKVGDVSGIIDKALALIDNSALATGVPGVLASRFTNTDAKALENYLDTIRANVGFDELQKMREMSPTGGALGSVSENENRLLQSIKGPMDIGQPEQLKETLESIRRNYERLLTETQAAVKADYGLDFNTPDDSGAPAGVDARVWEVMTPEERALWQGN